MSSSNRCKVEVGTLEPASGWEPTFSGDNQTTALDPLPTFAGALSMTAVQRLLSPDLAVERALSARSGPSDTTLGENSVHENLRRLMSLRRVSLRG